MIKRFVPLWCASVDSLTARDNDDHLKWRGGIWDSAAPSQVSDEVLPLRGRFICQRPGDGRERCAAITLHVWLGQKERWKDPPPESSTTLSHMTDAARSHVKMRQIAANQLHHLNCSSLNTGWVSFLLLLFASVDTRANCLSFTLHASRFEANSAHFPGYLISTTYGFWVLKIFSTCTYNDY